MRRNATPLAKALREMFPKLNQRNAQILADKFACLVENGIREKWSFDSMRLYVQREMKCEPGSTLRRCREAAGMTLLDAAKKADCSTSKISRIENGQVKVSRADAIFLLQLYNVTDKTVVEAVLSRAGKPQV